MTVLKSMSAPEGCAAAYAECSIAVHWVWTLSNTVILKSTDLEGGLKKLNSWATLLGFASNVVAKIAAAKEAAEHVNKAFIAITGKVPGVWLQSASGAKNEVFVQCADGDSAYRKIAEANNPAAGGIQLFKP